MTIDEEVQFTRAWWLRCIADPEKMKQWLIKLQQTEIDGYNFWVEKKGIYQMPEKTLRIVNNIAQDEKNHSSILVMMMRERGIQPVPIQGTLSTYWNEMYKAITDLETCIAVNHFGEALAAFRFEVIHDMRETPTDIKEALSIILPDEQFHRETLARLAGEDTLAKIARVHEKAVLNLKST